MHAHPAHERARLRDKPDATERVGRHGRTHSIILPVRAQGLGRGARAGLHCLLGGYHGCGRRRGGFPARGAHAWAEELHKVVSAVGLRELRALTCKRIKGY